ncbi:bacteriocin-like protein [Ascidiimonas aurantiaca]|uniref:bacteriocin-like protein n=1 Tax=Ascidiimonas aurantiaca TaxID=1685432 RepID=UPI003BB752A1
MKKISNISGVKKLNRNELKEIKGGSCTQQGNKCCERIPPIGQIVCVHGLCEFRTCIFF